MRTIRLKEYEPSTESLSASELEEVLATRIVGVTPRADGQFDLRPENVVGTVVRPGVRILIRPKVGLRNVFFLLSYSAGLATWNEEEFPYADDEDLFKAIAWLFEAEVRRSSRFGLVRDYRTREEALPTLRGRIDLDAQIKAHPGQHLPLYCRYQEHGEDTELNRVIKAAHRQLFRVADLDPQIIGHLRHHHRLFADVESVDYSPSSVPRLAFNRLNEAWEPPGRLAELILRSDSVRDETGTVEGISFTVDMNNLFERFIEAVVEKEATRLGWIVEPQAPRKLTSSIGMKPDLLLKRGARDCAVGDAKYKELALKDWPHADVYQLLAYCVALELPQGLLIYAGARPPSSQLVEAANVTLKIVGVDLEGRPRDVLRRAQRAARELIKQAYELVGDVPVAA